MRKDKIKAISLLRMLNPFLPLPMTKWTESKVSESSRNGMIAVG